MAASILLRRPARAALAGLAGALAYLAAQELDRRVANPRSDDLVLLGGLVTDDPAVWRPVGLPLHLLAGAAFGVVFDALVAPRLPGPYWLRGVIAAQAENATLWPLVLLLDRVHPAVARGQLAPLHRPVYAAQAVWRHLALGAAIGALLAPADVPRAATPRTGR